MDELRKHLEKERDLNCEAAAKELNNVKFEIESTRRGLESRQRNVEALVAEVLLMSSIICIYIYK